MAISSLKEPLKARAGRLALVAAQVGGWKKPAGVAALVVGLVSAGLMLRLSDTDSGFFTIEGAPVAVIALDGEGPNGTTVNLRGRVSGTSATLPLPNAAAEASSVPEQEIIETSEGGAKVIIIRPESGPSAALGPVPDERLVDRVDLGLLPKQADDGTSAMSVYARPSNFTGQPASTDRPRIAIMVTGMGLNADLTRQAIGSLPGGVTLAFAPYGRNLQDWVSEARQDGHEVMLQMPMEPFDYPNNDPGPHTLLTASTPQENMERLHWVMTRMVGYTGLTNYMGARFTAAREQMRPMLLELKKRGLLYVDDGTSPRSLSDELGAEIGLPTRRADVVLDATPSPDAISAAIERLEIEAFSSGMAVGVISALPVSVETVGQWLEGLNLRGIDLIPMSAAANVVAEG